MPRVSKPLRPRKKDRVRQASGDYAWACQATPDDHERLAELRRDIEVAKIIRAIEGLLDDSPLPTAEQRRFIADLILGGGESA